MLPIRTLLASALIVPPPALVPLIVGVAVFKKSLFFGEVIVGALSTTASLSPVGVLEAGTNFAK